MAQALRCRGLWSFRIDCIWNHLGLPYLTRIGLQDPEGELLRSHNTQEEVLLPLALQVLYHVANLEYNSGQLRRGANGLDARLVQVSASSAGTGKNALQLPVLQENSDPISALIKYYDASIGLILTVNLGAYAEACFRNLSTSLARS